MATSRTGDSFEIDVGDVMARLFARWKIILVVTVLAAVVVYGISSLLAKTYQSEATIYVQQSSVNLGLLRSLPVGLPTPTGGASGYFMSLLESDTMLKSVISDLKLEGRPDFGGPDQAMKRLRSRIRVHEDRNGGIDIVVRAPSPRLASDIANSFLDSLGKLVTTSSTRKATFISSKLDDVGKKLKSAEDELLEFQKAHDVAAIDEETRAMIDRLAELEGRSLAMEIDLRQVEGELENAGELSGLVELEVRKKSIESSKSYLDDQIGDMQRKMTALPAVTLKYARLQRSVQILSKTLELLTEQYQLATVSQHGEDGDYQIIDRARPIPQPVSPRKMLNAALGGALGFIVCAFLVVRSGRARRVGGAYASRPAAAEPPRVRR